MRDREKLPMMYRPMDAPVMIQKREEEKTIPKFADLMQGASELNYLAERYLGSQKQKERKSKK